MSSSYPKVHVVGSGAYYSYRPITRFIEKVERNHYRDNSSKPKDFQQYLAAISHIHGDGYRRDPINQSSVGDSRTRGSSMPAFSRTGEAHERAEKTQKAIELELEEEMKDYSRDPETDMIQRLRRKHPYRLPVENEYVPPHESSVWPAHRKHFDLVSSYDLMVDFMGIRQKENRI